MNGNALLGGLVWTIVLVWSFGAPPLRAEPTIERVRPQAVCPGRGVEVTFSGKDLGLLEDLSLWTSFSATSVRVASDDDRESEATFLVTAAKDVQVGVGVVRLVSPRGASNPFLLMVDDLSHSGDSAEKRKLSLPAAVDGECVLDRAGSFAFEVTAGERWTFDVVSQRLGSVLDPVVRLFDPAGRELVHCDDSNGLGADCRFAHTFEKGGTHRIELRSVDYRGGASYRYRLRVGEFPAVAAVFPMGARSGRETTFLVREGASSEVFSFAPDRPDDRVYVSVPGRQGSGFVPVSVSRPGDTDELVEGEDIDGSVETETWISIPQIMNGRFDRAGDRDAFRLEVARGQRVVFEGRTRSLGSAAELHLELRRANGEVLARSRAAGSDEGFFDHEFEAAGEYVLVVEELNLQGGDGFFYRLEARPFRPTFRLALETERVKVERGGEFKLKVSCERKGYDGPIDLGLQGALAGFEVLSGKIAKGKESGEIKVSVPEFVEGGRLFLPSIVGRAKAGGALLEIRASTAPALKKLFPRLGELPAVLEYRLAVVVTE